MTSWGKEQHLPWRIYAGGQLPALAAAPDAHVQSLLVTPGGDVWVKAGSDIFVYRDSLWEKIATSIEPILGFLTWYNERVWLAGTWGIRAHALENWSPVPAAAFDAVLCITVDRANTLWVGTAGLGLWCSPDGLTWNRVPLPSGGMTIAALAADSGGTLWIAEGGSGRTPPERRIFRMREHAWETLPLPSDHRPFRYITALASGTDSLWVGTYEGGVFRWYDDSWDQFRQSRNGASSGLPANTIMSLCTDHHDRVWATTHNGLGVFDEGYWSMALVQPLAEPAGRKIEPRPVMGGHCLELAPDGQLWVGAHYPQVVWIDADRQRIM